MALTREQKTELLASYQQGLAEAPHAFLLDYKGISVPQVTELRARVREHGGSYLVVKNTLALRAIEGKALAGLAAQFEGPTAVVFSDGDPVPLAKALTEFAKTSPVLQFKGAMVERRTVPAEQIKEIADLPSRQELIARLLSMLQSPIARLVRTLGAVPQRFVGVLDQVAKSREGQA
jgi:large subunit ribosomal protein L10